MDVSFFFCIGYTHAHASFLLCMYEIEMAQNRNQKIYLFKKSFELLNDPILILYY